MIEIAQGIKIREDLLTFKFSRSTGPGGQNVNKVNTKVTVLFDVAGCNSFSAAQKKRMLKKLATRISKNGLLRVVCQRYRTQKANRTAAIERLQKLLTTALHAPRARKKTSIPKAAREKRLEEKRQRSFLKKQRAKKNLLDEF
jgi:ribosome-associated protein